MSISESQLETWSHQGSKVQSAATYGAIRSVLEDGQAPYASREFKVFLQGSYGNDTNVYADSDVDVVICLSSVFYTDTSDLSDLEKETYEANRQPSAYRLSDFKGEVLDWLTQRFGSGVKPGKKAIFVPGNGGRRDSDVLVCAEHRRYISYQSLWTSRYHEGICFWMQQGEKIVNYPKQHRENCTVKHQATQSRFKPSVRVLKNLRNAMISDGRFQKGTAPSYFVEGMLWNLPETCFAGTFQQTIEISLRWLGNCDPEKLLCANERHWLIRDGASVCWNMADYRIFLVSVEEYWSSSGR